MMSMLHGLARKPTRRAIGARVWYERGLEAEVRGDLAGAREAYQRTLAANPELADAACNLGRLVHEGGGAAEAEQWYRLALCGNRKVAVYWFNLGVSIEDQGRGAEAIACYQLALACDAGLADAHFNLARLLERAGDLESARAAVQHLQAYRRAIG